MKCQHCGKETSAKGNENNRYKRFAIRFDSIEVETEKARKVIVNGGAYWLPKSQSSDPDGNVIEVARWLLEDKGIPIPDAGIDAREGQAKSPPPEDLWDDDQIPF